MKTLLVDDDAALRTFLGAVLAERGHEIVACADAETAWRALQHDVFGLILLDWRLPGMNGLELCRRIRTQPQAQESEIVLITADARPEGLHDALAAGANEYLLKPFPLAVLEVRLTIAEQRARAAEKRAQVDAALAESVAHYRTLVEQLPDVIYTAALEPPYATTYISPRVETLLGVTPPVWLAASDPWREHLHPDDRARVLAARQEARATGRSVVVEYRARTRTGGALWVREALAVVRDPAGQATSLQGVLADRTAQNEAEQATRHLAAIVASSDDAIIGTTLDGRITSWNRGAAHIYGYTAEEVLGRQLAVVMPADRPDEFPRIVECLRQGEGIAHDETVGQRKDGQQIAVALTLSVLQDTQGRITGVAAIARDITAQKRAEETLRFQAHLLAAVGQAVIGTDLAGRITYWNRAAETLYGWSAAEVLGRPVVEVTPAPASAAVGAEIMATLQRGAVWEGEFAVRRRDGSTFPAQVSTTPIQDTDGTLLGIVGVSADITARKQAEDALRRHAQAQEGLAVLTRLATSSLDLETLLPRLCQAVTEAADVAHASLFLLAGPETLRLAATTLPDLGAPGALEPLAAHLFAAGQAAREVRALYYNEVAAELARLDHPPETAPPAGEAAASVLAVPLVLADAVVGALALGSAEAGHFGPADLARAAEVAQVIEGALRNARLYQREHAVAEQLRQVERWRTGFLRVMAHEVRTPLGQISGFSDLLGGEAARLTERGQRYLTNVQEAAARLEHLVQRSFDLLRLYADEGPRSRGPLVVSHLVEQALAAYRGQATAKDVVLRARHANDDLLEVEGDGQQLFQALAILLDNAVTFTPAGGVIEVAVERAAGLVEVAVCDSGPGVPEEVRASIFAGGQAEDPLTRQHGGLGLSLLMARRIAELHGGQLRLDAPAQGACFVLALPVRSATGQAERAAVSQTTLRHQLVNEPGSVAVVYWGPQRLAPDEARAALSTLQGHERVVLVGRFAYVEAPPPGQPERRAAEEAPAPRGLRLADQLTDPAMLEALEQRVQAALGRTGLTVPSARLGVQTGLPGRTLEALCYAWEEKGLLQVLQPTRSGGAERGGREFVVLQVTLAALTRALHPTREPGDAAEQAPTEAHRPEEGTDAFASSTSE